MLPALPPPPDLLARWVPISPPAITGDIHPAGKSTLTGPPPSFAEEMEAYAASVESGLKDLLMAVPSGLDLEALLRRIREQARRQKEQERRLRRMRVETVELQRRGRAGAQVKLTADKVDCALRQHRRATAAYENCLIELSKLRQQRLRAYNAEWINYLNSVRESAASLADDVAFLWSQFESSLWPPEASLTEDGLLMVWDFDQHHLEVEVFRNGLYDWFYRNRNKAGHRGEEELPVRSPSGSLAAIIKKLEKAKSADG